MSRRDLAHHELDSHFITVIVTITVSVLLQASQPPEAGESDEYKQTVEKLRGILDDRQGKYSFADIRVPLQSEEHGSLAAEAVVVAYR